MSRAEIAAKAIADAEAKMKAEAKRKKEMAAKGGNDYMGVLEENNNKLEDVDAHSVEEAINALSVEATTDKGKRVNLKAEYAKFQEAEMARLRVDQPGLKLSQYKERCWKAWQSSPENPMNGQ